MKKALFLLVSLSVANLGFGYGAFLANYTITPVAFHVTYNGLKHDFARVLQDSS